MNQNNCPICGEMDVSPLHGITCKDSLSNHMRVAKNKWLVISWKSIPVRENVYQKNQYGNLMDEIVGTEEEARECALAYVPEYSPIGIVREITPSKGEL